MEISVNEPKSKSFNIYLRMFHLGLQLAAAYWANVYDGMSSCKHQFVDFISFIAYALIAFNLVSLIVMRCSSKFPRMFFFISYLIDLILSGGACAMSVIGYMQYRGCTSNRVIFAFTAL